MEAVTSRRRGATLEDAILDAAWAELLERGYAEMTLEAVAQRAGTSRPVLHRRWPSRVNLATAALARYLTQNPIQIPDLGSVGAEMRLFLRKMSDRARPDLVRLFFDMTGDLMDAKSNFAEVRAEFANDRVIRAILDRGVARGEIDAHRLTPRLVGLPTDLARHEMLMTLKPVSDEVIREIVEEIFLPLAASRPI
ncbi:MAG: TetR/AcrR family transcriptional regulator [Beijerinckiaceae bacterium]|nr:TetR/AcrR family transcriptional regulator [Beijerinckiaceae bacterium]